MFFLERERGNEGRNETIRKVRAVRCVFKRGGTWKVINE